MTQEESKQAAVVPVSCYINVGDIIKGRCRNGFLFDGELCNMDIKQSDNKLCPMITVVQRLDTTVPLFGVATIEVANIVELEIIQSHKQAGHDESAAMKGGRNA